MTSNLASKKTKGGLEEQLKAFEEKLNIALATITVKDLAVFARQFAAMFNAGVPMVRCLKVLREQTSNYKIKYALKMISAEVEEGSELSEAMRKHPACFDELFLSMVAAGEVGGVLDEVLERLAVMLEKNAKTLSEINSAMSYPKTVMFIALAVFFGMTTFLLPTFAKIFEEIGTELPAFTIFMLGISAFCRTWPPIPQVTAIGTIIFIYVVYTMVYKTEQGRLFFDRIFLKLPIFGDIIEKSAVARFCMIFGTLTRSGVPMLKSLEIVRNVAGNAAIAESVEYARQEIQSGGMISLALQEKKVFPSLAVQMMAIGEETGELDAMLMKVGSFYEQEVEEAVKSLTSMLEPLMIVVIGAMVGAILLSMYLPMFKVFEDL